MNFGFEIKFRVPSSFLEIGVHTYLENVRNGFNSPFRLEKSGVYDEINRRFEAKNCSKTPEEK